MRQPLVGGGALRSSAVARMGLSLSGAVVGLVGCATMNEVLAGHTNGYQSTTGTCDGYPTYWVMVCRTNYVVGQPAMYVRDIRPWVSPSGVDWSDLFEAPLAAAESAWRAAPGPQEPSSAARTNDTWNYWKAVLAGGDRQGLLGPYDFALTYVCNVDGQCSPYDWAINIHWAEVYVNSAFTGQLTEAQRTSVMAHEMGHTLGLTHHSPDGSYDDGALMFPTLNYANPRTGPTSIDAGSRTQCRYGTVPKESWGVRCIYNWYETPTPTRTPTPRPTATRTPTPTPTASGGGGGK